MNIPSRAVLGLASVLLVSCRPALQQSSPAQSKSAGRHVYQVHGVIQEVMADRNKLKIQHEKIPNYMDAMTMTFDVRGATHIDQLQPGDGVSFDMVVTPTDGWIEHVEKTGGATPVRAPFRVVRDVDPLEAGDFMPNYHFTNELGRPVNLTDYKGQVLAFTFIFTRCPFPTFCPRMTSNFAEVLQELKAMPNAPANWRLLTITFDPEFDTPALLHAYAKQFNYDPEHWSFLTGDLIEITAAAEQFGLMFWRSDPAKPAAIDHNVRTVVLDPQGRVSKIIPENEWKPRELVQAIIAAAHPAESVEQ